MGGVSAEDIDDVGDKTKETIYAQKSETHRYKSGDFRRRKKQKNLTKIADEQVRQLAKSDK